MRSLRQPGRFSAGGGKKDMAWTDKSNEFFEHRGFPRGVRLRGGRTLFAAPKRVEKAPGQNEGGIKLGVATGRAQFVSRGDAIPPRGGYLWLERRQMPNAPAWRISSSRKSGWARPMMASARCQVERPLRLAMPYSVTR